MSAAKRCPTCDTEYPPEERFCPKDGAILRVQGGADIVGSIIAERYHVLQKLGEGGMGQVYLAEHVKMRRKSAVKLMNPGTDQDADAIARFNREAANASRINHPNVAGIYDFGETTDGMIFLAMEYIEGESLSALLHRTGPLQPARAADIVRQVADGLGVAHELGIVHRDLKPDNIMIAKGRSGADLVKVVDFGIAKAAGAASDKVTRTGLSVGTPEYMSPEQLAGDAVGHTSDIYSLGLVAFRMLTGVLPFEGRTSQEVLMKRFTESPRPLSECRPEVAWPESVLRAMQHALEARSEDRYQSATAYGADLVAAVAEMPDASTGATQLMRESLVVPIAAEPAATSVTNPMMRRVAIVSVVACVAVLGWFGANALRAGGGNSRNAIAVLPFESLNGDTANTYLGEGIADELATSLAKVPGLTLAGRTSVRALRDRQATIRDIGREFHVGSVVQGSVRRYPDSVRVTVELGNANTGVVAWRENYTYVAKDVFTVQDVIAREIAKELKVTLATGTGRAAERGTSNVDAYDDYLRGYYQYSRRGARIAKAIEYFSLAVGADSSFARAWAGLGLSLAASTIYGGVDAADVLPRALQAAERAVALDPKSAEAYMSMGLVHTYAQRWTKGEDAYKQAIVLDSTLALVRMHYGRLLFTVGRLPESLAQLERGKRLDPLNANLHATMASALWRLGRGADAELSAKRAFELDSTVNAARTQVLMILVSNGKADEARAHANRLLTYVGTDLVVRGTVAYAFARIGDMPRALAMIDSLERSAADSRADVALTRAYLGTRDAPKALAAMERVVNSHRPFAVSQEFQTEMFDPVRGNPKYDELLRKMDLDPAKLQPVAAGTRP